MFEKSHVRSADKIKHMDFRYSGFVVRKRTAVNTLSKGFMAISATVLGVVGVLFYDVSTGVYICMGTGAVMMFASIQLQRIQKMQQSTEFMNAIFSFALGKNYRFCIALHNSGEIIYVNRTFQEAFPLFCAQSISSLKKLCEMQGIEFTDQQNLHEKILLKQESSLTIPMRIGGDPYLQTITFLIEPIHTLKGYVLIRGK